VISGTGTPAEPSETSPEDSRSRLGLRDAAILLGLGLLVRVPLVLAHPAIHGGDSVLRLARSETLILGHWLPLPQLLVFLIRAVAPDPLWTRLAFVLAGSLGGVALAWVVTVTAGAASGRAAGALFLLHPLLVYYSLVPYQEAPMLLLLLAGAAALVHDEDVKGGLALGLACLCRYEAWIAAGMAALVRWRRPLRATLLFGWAPLAWIGAWRGLAPRGSYILDTDLAAVGLGRVSFFFAKLEEYSGDLLLVLALAGALVALRRRPRGWAWGAGFVMVFLAAQLAFGHEHPAGSGRLNERMIHVPAVALCALGGLALGTLSERLAWRGLPLGAVLAALLLAGLGVRWTHRTEALVVEANKEPSLRLAADVARWSDQHLPPRGRLAVAAVAVSPVAIQYYVRKVELAGADVERARVIAAELATHSLDLERIRAQLPRRPSTVVRAGSAPADIVAVYDDAPDAALFRLGPALARFVEGGRGVSLYRAGKE
jgi:hypothetical protein